MSYPIEVIEQHKGKVKKSKLIKFLTRECGLLCFEAMLIAGFVEIDTYKYSCWGVDSYREHELQPTEFVDIGIEHCPDLSRKFEYVDEGRSVRVYKNIEDYPVAILKHSRHWDRSVSISRLRIATSCCKDYIDVVSNNAVEKDEDWDEYDSEYAEFCQMGYRECSRSIYLYKKINKRKNN